MARTTPRTSSTRPRSARPRTSSTTSECPRPFDDWPPLDCVKTRPTGRPDQLVTGLNLRIFGYLEPVSARPTTRTITCADGTTGTGRTTGTTARTSPGTSIRRASLDDQTNHINPADPRLVTLFFTPYDSFSGTGQEVFPIVALGQFYITGYGRLNGSGSFQGGGPDDPCNDGANSLVYPYAGNDPPPDLNTIGGAAGGVVIWGHFLKGVVQSGATQGGYGPCIDGEPQPLRRSPDGVIRTPLGPWPAPAETFDLPWSAPRRRSTARIRDLGPGRSGRSSVRNPSSIGETPGWGKGDWGWGRARKRAWRPDAARGAARLRP